MKQWLQKHYLPMWAKQTLLWEKQQLERENLILRQELERLEAYVSGLKTGLRAKNRGGDK